MRAKDPRCKRHPEVCGNVACHQDPNSLVCQKPMGHGGGCWDDAIDLIYREWCDANRDWLKEHGARANGEDIRAAGPEIFRRVVGPHLNHND